jgi:hypothetical protein
VFGVAGGGCNAAKKSVTVADSGSRAERGSDGKDESTKCTVSNNASTSKRLNEKNKTRAVLSVASGAFPRTPDIAKKKKLTAITSVASGASVQEDQAQCQCSTDAPLSACVSV